MKVLEFLEAKHHIGETVTLSGIHYRLSRDDITILEDIRDYLWYCQRTAMLSTFYEYCSPEMRTWVDRINKSAGITDRSNIRLWEDAQEIY
jgi:hypothetical protein